MTDNAVLIGLFRERQQRMQDETQMRVHPAANCFRMMREDELAALVEDIRENGLRDPITLGRVSGRDFDELVDGRNRLKACDAGGIEPHFETRQFKDDDKCGRSCSRAACAAI
jgi:hypothetical protein